jgi:hypothetical protein
LGFCLIVVALIWAGCQTNVPTQSALATGPDKNLVVTITATSAGINPNLYVDLSQGQTLGLPLQALGLSYAADVIITNPPVTLGYWKGVPITCVGSPCTAQVAHSAMTEIATGMPQNPYAVQVTGFINDPESYLDPPGPGQYDSVGITIWPAKNGKNFFVTDENQKGYYDISPFQGIQFYFKVSSGDSANNRAFSIATAQQIPSPTVASYISPNGGLCGDPSRPDLTGCYDTWNVDLSTVVKEQWVFVQRRWSDFITGGYGSTPVPPSLSGDNLRQFQTMGFGSSNGAQAGPVSVNFSFTGLRFF